MRPRAILLVVLLSGCALARLERPAEEAIVDARRAELVLARETSRTLREIAAVVSDAREVLGDARPKVSQVLGDAAATSAEFRSRAWLVWALACAIGGALASSIFRRRDRA